MGIMDPEEVREFALFLVKGEGEPPCRLDSERQLHCQVHLGARERGGPRLGWQGCGQGCEPGLPTQTSRCGPCGPTSTSTAWWTRTRACTAGGSAGRPSCTLTTPPTSTLTTARSAPPGRASQAPLPTRRSDAGVGGAFGHSCPLTALPSQVQRDYLQGKLLVSAQADAQVARLAALQLLSRAHKDPPSE